MKRLIQSKGGSTMVNVLVAFTMLMIVCGMFYRTVTLSLSLSEKTEATRQNTEQALIDYYAGKQPGSEAELAFSGTSGSFDIAVEYGEFTAANGYKFCYFD